MLFKGVRTYAPRGTVVADVRVRDGHVVPTGAHESADGGEVIDGTGLALVAVVPAQDGRGHVVGAVEAGPADLLLVPERVMPRRGAAWWTVVVSRRDVRALLTGGRPVIRDGEPLDRPANPDRSRLGLGVWVDRSGYLLQELRPDGRYSETRAGRRDAYTGRYWLDGDRIDYLDDSGFYAFGERIGDELFHAEYVLRLRGNGAG